MKCGLVPGHVLLKCGLVPGQVILKYGLGPRQVLRKCGLVPGGVILKCEFPDISTEVSNKSVLLILSVMRNPLKKPARHGIYKHIYIYKQVET